GVLFWHDSPNDQIALAGLREGLTATGRPFELVVRDADSDPARAAGHIAEFCARPVGAIVALGTEAARIAAAETRGIPVVFTAVTDPVNSGIVPSWKGSGSLVAGNSNHIDPNRVINDFKRAVPALRALGVLSSPDNRVSRAEIEGMEAALRERASLGIRLVRRSVAAPGDLVAAAEALLAESDALWIPIDYAVYSHIDAVAEVARRHRKPIVTTSQKVELHATVAVLPDYHVLGMQAVEILDRILRRGVEPGRIPVGVMQGRLLVINLEAARQCGVAVPIPALAAADRIVPERPRS
ncbi:MAG: ABC transporter substrate-binding protein, partial [Planctomycetes bacterium]|nr:ABC transporter substrate-binding protein [Planctomycetota bacterium]